MQLKIFYENINRSSAALFFLIAILLVYGQSFFFQTNIDDYLLLDAIDGKINSGQGLFHLLFQPFHSADYRPLSAFTLGLENLVFGKIHPGFSHFINVILFFLIALLADKLLNRLTEKKFTAEIFFVILLFICSPINVEAVASIKNRDNLFSLLFTLLSFYLLTDPATKNKLFRIITGLLFFFIAMLAKRDSVGLILLLPVYLLFFREKFSRQKAVGVLLTFVALIVLFIARDFLAHSIISSAGPQDFTVKITYTENPLAFDYRFPNRLAALFQTNWIYLQKLLIPYGLRYYYGFDHYQLYTFANFQLWGMIIAQLIFLSLIILFGKRNKYIFLGLSGYVFFIVYALNFLEPAAGIAADRFALQAGIWFWLMAVLLLSEIPLKKFPWQTVCVLLILIYGAVSVYRTSAWKDKMTLVNRDIKHLSKSYEAQRIAAAAYFENWEKINDHSNLQTALEYAQNGNRLYPQNAIMHKLQGIILFNLQDYAAAKKELEISFKNDSASAETLEMLGDIAYVQKNYPEAQQKYFAAQQLKNTNELVNKISTAIYESGDKDSCVRYNLELIKNQPQLFAPYENLGYFYLDQRDSSTAKKYFDLAKQKGLSDQTPL